MAENAPAPSSPEEPKTSAKSNLVKEAMDRLGIPSYEAWEIPMSDLKKMLES